MTEAGLETDLAAELAWVRRLARAISRDATLADELAHDAMAVADRAPAEHRAKWFGRVLRNLLRMRRRSARRRKHYESVADPRTIATPEELVARTEAQRAVSGAVMALAEPYRSTVVLRYAEDLSSAEIARRLDVPEGTVRRRLKVALERLRAELDPDGQGARRFALLLLVRRPGSAALVTAAAAVVVLAAAIAITVALRRAQVAGALAGDVGRRAASPLVEELAEEPPPRLAAPAPLGPALPCKILSGQVRDAVGPVAGARVSSAGEAVITDDAGHYQLCIHPIHAIVRVEAPGYGAIEEGRLHPTEALEHDFALVPEAPLHGRVVDRARRPLAGARVVARPGRDDPGAAGGTAITDADGSFTIAGIGPERLDVIATIDDRTGRADAPANARELAVEIVADHVVRPATPATVTGTVTRHGRGVAGAEVWCLTTTDVATTSDDGGFVLAGVSPGRCALVAMTATAASKILPLELVAGEIRRVDVDAAYGGSIHGTVVDLAGAGVRGAIIVATGADGVPAADTLSDARGAFTLTTLPADRYALSVYPSPALGVPFRADPVSVLVGNDAAVDGVQLAIDNRQIEIRGRVVDEAGAPLPDAYVEARHGEQGQFPAATRTALDGSFAIRKLVAGSYVVRARAGDGRRGEQDVVAAGRGEVVLVLAR